MTRDHREDSRRAGVFLAFREAAAQLNELSHNMKGIAEAAHRAALAFESHVRRLEAEGGRVLEDADVGP